MAVVASPLNLKRVTVSANDSKKRVTEARNSIKNVGQIIFRKTKVKRDAFTQTNLFRKRREENEKRQQLESELEAPRSVVTPGGPQKLAQTGVGGFFDRIFGFLGYLAAGWLMNNLPTWIAMGKEFVARIQRAGQIVSGFFNNTIKLFINVGNVLGALGQNLLRFDFFDTSNRVKDAMGGLNTTVGNLTSQIEEAFGLLTTPLTEGKYSGEKIPETGTRYQDEGAYTEPPPYSGGIGGGNKPSVGTQEQRAMLDAIAFAEGTRDQPNGGYKTLFGFEQFSDYSRHPDRVVRKGGYASAAAGRYQFMPGTFNRLAKKLGLKDFSPQSQDRAALELAKELGITPEVLRREGMSPKVSALLGRQWASFPGKTIGLDQPTKKLKEIQKAYNISLGSPQQPAQTPPTKAITPIVTSRYGESRGTRTHGGSDLAVKQGTSLRAVSDGVIVDSDYENGWGNFLVMRDNLGIYHLYGHMQSGYKRSGPVKKGEVIGKVGMSGRTSGPHLHWETGTGWNGGTLTGKFDPLKKYSKFAPFNTTSEAQMSAPPQQSAMVPFSLTPERRGQDIMIIEPQQQQNIITPASGGGDMAPSPINDFDLLNNFIKNKLLLDLAYL
jgi:murein DD-endopeptidase MepM/ murein hydrolase activator NlpD